MLRCPGALPPNDTTGSYVSTAAPPIEPPVAPMNCGAASHDAALWCEWLAPSMATSATAGDELLRGVVVPWAGGWPSYLYSETWGAGGARVALGPGGGWGG